MTRPQDGIRAVLCAIGAIDPGRIELFAGRTRDGSIPVWWDPQSGVIFIDGNYVGDQTYADSVSAGPRTFEDWADTNRRVSALAPYYVGKSIVDFGCGDGSFLKAIQSDVAAAAGVELSNEAVENLRKIGITCASSITEFKKPLDTAFMFHVLEHLPQPLESLRQISERLAPGGRIVVEVPHARDWLLAGLECQPFVEFTLWSQHLVLHTRDSLRRLLTAAGFGGITIRGVQRYSLANHVSWLSKGVPGGHKEAMAVLETPSFQAQYESALASIDATDTLMAVASRI